MGMVSGYSLKSSSPDSSVHWICGHLICVLDHTDTVVASCKCYVIVAFTLSLAHLCLHPLVPWFVALLLFPAPLGCIENKLDWRNDLTSFKKHMCNFFGDTCFFFSFLSSDFFFYFLKKRLISIPVCYTVRLCKRLCQNNKRWWWVLLLKKFVSDARPFSFSAEIIP